MNGWAAAVARAFVSESACSLNLRSRRVVSRLTFAAASSFVGAILVAGRAPDLLAIPTFIVGFIGLGYFLKRAERHHESRRRP